MEICHHKNIICLFVCLLSLGSEATLPIEAAQEFQTIEMNHELFEELKETTPRDGYQSPTLRPRRGSWEEVSRGLLCRVTYGGGLVLPGRYGSHDGLLRTLKRLANGALVKLGGPVTHKVDTKRLQNP